MTLNAPQLELPYFIPTAGNLQQILTELRSAEINPIAVQDEDFYLFRQRRQPWRWAGRYAGTHSESNFATEAAVIADAQAKLA